MDTHLADDKLRELDVEHITVKANDRKIARYEIDPEAGDFCATSTSESCLYFGFCSC